MNTSGSMFGRLGRVGIVFAGVVALWWMITHYAKALDIDTRGEQVLAFVLVCLVLVLIRYAPALSRYVKEVYYRRQAQKINALPDEEGRITLTPPRHITVEEIRQELCHLYGRCWPRKLRILLITGSASDVEQLIPKLTQEFWQEDQGTLLLWGGDPAAPADTAWLTALRKLRRRPVDGVVWVTSAFDRLAGSDTELAAPLTPESMDALAHALKGRYDALGWKLPLYVWSLHPRAGEQLGRITQPVGYQLSAASKPEALARQLSDLIPALTAQGVQQICDKPQQSFLLALADQLTREPETLTGPLSVLLKPYRPLPLAGVVFSPSTFGGVRSVAHHWGKDNRWDAIPASAQALPAGLRPRKPGISWTQMAGVSVAALMVLWGVSMAVSFVANRHLVATAQEQVQQSVAEKQPLSTRLHALSELQKTLVRLQYRGQHGVPWYARGGLSQNDALLAALFPRYGESALPLLRDAAAEHLTQQLHAFVQLPPDSPLRERMAKPVYDRLRLYLMLSRPEKMDAAWFSATLMRYWSQRAGVANGLWQGSGPALYAFMPRAWRHTRSGAYMLTICWSARRVRCWFARWGCETVNPPSIRKCSRRWRTSMPICA